MRGALRAFNPLATSVASVTHRSVIWGTAALLGIAATAAVAWSASQLAGQRIGLASEPLAVASTLAPRGQPPHRVEIRQPKRVRPRAAPAAPAPVIAAAPT